MVQLPHSDHTYFRGRVASIMVRTPCPHDHVPGVHVACQVICAYPMVAAWTWMGHTPICVGVEGIAWQNHTGHGARDAKSGLI